MSLSHQKKMRTLRGFYVGICLWNDVQTKWFDFLSGLCHAHHARAAREMLTQRSLAVSPFTRLVPSNTEKTPLE
jgi:hypothetical protein